MLTTVSSLMSSSAVQRLRGLPINKWTYRSSRICRGKVIAEVVYAIALVSEGLNLSIYSPCTSKARRTDMRRLLLFIRSVAEPNCTQSVVLPWPMCHSGSPGQN